MPWGMNDTRGMEQPGSAEGELRASAQPLGGSALVVFTADRDEAVYASDIQVTIPHHR